MFGLKVTINDEQPVVAAAQDLGSVTAMLTASGVLGNATQPSWTGERHECHLSLRGRTSRHTGVDDQLLWIQRWGLSVGDRVTIEIVETNHPAAPRSDETNDMSFGGQLDQMFAFVVTVNDCPPITAAAEDLYVQHAAAPDGLPSLGLFAQASRRTALRADARW